MLTFNGRYCPLGNLSSKIRRGWYARQRKDHAIAKWRLITRASMEFCLSNCFTRRSEDIENHLISMRWGFSLFCMKMMSSRHLRCLKLCDYEISRCTLVLWRYMFWSSCSYLFKKKKKFRSTVTFSGSKEFCWLAYGFSPAQQLWTLTCPLR